MFYIQVVTSGVLKKDILSLQEAFTSTFYIGLSMPWAYMLACRGMTSSNEMKLTLTSVLQLE
jgi:hypothetical protein